MFGVIHDESFATIYPHNTSNPLLPRTVTVIVHHWSTSRAVLQYGGEQARTLVGVVLEFVLYSSLEASSTYIVMGIFYFPST